jgi:hypothetical protein
MMCLFLTCKQTEHRDQDNEVSGRPPPMAVRESISIVCYHDGDGCIRLCPSQKVKSRTLRMMFISMDRVPEPLAPA